MPLPIFDQVFIDPKGRRIVYKDRRQNDHSLLAQPRDIQIASQIVEELSDEHDYREEIAVSIRRSQGCSDIGVRKNLRWS